MSVSVSDTFQYFMGSRNHINVTFTVSIDLKSPGREIILYTIAPE